MKKLVSVVATNSVITLADGTREVIANEALEEGARQINEGRGLPSFIEHDSTRLIGWSNRSWTLRDDLLLRLVVETEIPETEDERERLQRKYVDYLAAEAKERTAPYEKVASDFGVNGVELSYDKAFVLLKSPRLVEHYWPEIVAATDQDGLIQITEEMIGENGGIRRGAFYLVPSNYLRASFELPNQVNGELLAALFRLVRKAGQIVRVRVEPDLLAIPESFRPIAQREYWWGPKYGGDPSKQQRGVVVHGPTKSDIFNQLIRTEFWWYGKTETTFEAEELLDRQVTLHSAAFNRGMRFVHSIFDTSTNKSRHIDGAIRLYSDLQWTNRIATNISKFGKQASRMKLWRVDGQLDHSEWYELIHAYFRGNYTIGEYFGLPDPKTQRSDFEASLNR